MEVITYVLTPLIEAMRFLLGGLHSVTADYGLSIIILSIIMRIVTMPLAKLASRAEERSRLKQAAMQPELDEIRASSRGRERFERTEAVYQKHHYHPIHAATSILPLFLQIPFLLAALILLSGYEPMAGERFLLIRDLLRPDMLLTIGTVAINVLPVLITLVALVESAFSGAPRSDRIRFLIVAVVIAVLIYGAPAGVCLYWLTSNILSLLRATAKRFAAKAD